MDRRLNVRIIYSNFRILRGQALDVAAFAGFIAFLAGFLESWRS